MPGADVVQPCNTETSLSTARMPKPEEAAVLCVLEQINEGANISCWNNHLLYDFGQQ